MSLAILEFREFNKRINRLFGLCFLGVNKTFRTVKQISVNSLVK